MFLLTDSRQGVLVARQTAAEERQNGLKPARIVYGRASLGIWSGVYHNVFVLSKI